MNITVNNSPGAPTPTFNPAAGTYSSAQTVTIGTTTGGATIRYTTDGSTPERDERHGLQQPGEHQRPTPR